MKKVLVVLTVLTLLAVGAVAYAHGTGWRGGGQMMGPSYCSNMGQGYGGHMGQGYGGHMGPGYGGHMGQGYGGHMGQGYGGHMGQGSGGHMGPGYGGHMQGSTDGYDQKFLDETADLRKELHNKKFEYFEANRNPKTDTETITELEKEIRELKEKIFEKAPRTADAKGKGYGCRY
jgi:hypothetical protein